MGWILRVGWLLMGLVGFGATAGAWPDKPVRLVVPYPAGAMGDTIARLLADELRVRLGQPVLVDNRAGAGGNIGAAAVAQAPADGHTLLVAATNNLVINQFLYAHMPFDPLKDLEPVTILVEVPTVLFAPAGLGVGDWKAFADLVKSGRGPFNYGSPGAGTTVHLLTETLNKRYALGLAHVAYKGASQALTAVIANEVQLLALGAAVGRPHVQSGKLRALAVASPHRLAQLPDTQTFAQAGLPDTGSGNWWAVAVPAGTPAERVARLNAVLRDAMASPKVAARLDELGVQPAMASLQETRQRLEREAADWARLVRETGARID